MQSAVPAPKPLGITEWLICFIAVIGFAFDIYELLMLPLIVKPAIATLSAPLIEQMVQGGMARPEVTALWLPGGELYVKWARTLFFVPAIFGGIFGLIGGYLTDRLGRRRVLTFSILLYAFAAGAAGFSTSLTQLLICRCLVFIGVCIEFVAAVAWLAELFPNPTQREKVLGFTQAFSSLGGFMVSGAYLLCVKLAADLPAIHGGHEAWRYTLISGLIPAIPLIVIRPFLPESPVWQRKRETGQLRRPSLAALFTPELARTTLVTAVIVASCYGMAFGAIQHLPQIVPGLADVKAAAKARQDAMAQEAVARGNPAPDPKALAAAGRSVTEEYAGKVQLWQEVGGMVGRLALAGVIVLIASKRLVLRLFHVPAMLWVTFFFWWLSHNLGQTGNIALVKWGAALCGFFVVATFSFWGNYLPLVYPVHLRGTGESFAANIGGRILGTSAAWFTFTFSAAKPPDPAKIALTAAAVAATFALIGFIASWWLTEPKPEQIEH
jgi:MFS family permease